MAKMKALPKKPKQSANLATWERYEAKVKEVQSVNAKKMADINKKAAIVKRSQGVTAVKGKLK